jgi:hypothetical protein
MYNNHKRVEIHKYANIHSTVLKYERQQLQDDHCHQQPQQQVATCNVALLVNMNVLMS